jgi:rhodanese-related sulfurtransferase
MFEGNENPESNEENNQIIRNISPYKAAKLVEENSENPDFVILDVRTSKEFDEGHLEGALLMDFYADDFQEQIEKGDKEKKYLICCGSGVRGSKTIRSMEDAGYMEVYNILGGVRMWEKSRLPLTKK